MFVFHETVITVESYFFLPNVSHLLWVHWLFGIQIWLCFAVNREKPGKSDLAVLRSVWDQDSTTDVVLLSAEFLGPTWEGGGLLAAQTAERGKWKCSRSQKTAKTKTKPRQQKGACWGNFKLASWGFSWFKITVEMIHCSTWSVVLCYSAWLDVVTLRRLAWSTLLPGCHRTDPITINYSCSFMVSSVWNRGAMSLDWKQLLY